MIINSWPIVDFYKQKTPALEAGVYSLKLGRFKNGSYIRYILKLVKRLPPVFYLL